MDEQRGNKMKKGLQIIVASLMAIQAPVAVSWAQDDFFTDDFASPPPPPPPPTDFGDDSGENDFPTPPSGPTSVSTSKSSATSDSGTLSDEQKAKFANSGIEDITNDNFPELIESFDFQNVDLQDIVKAISELTGKNFIIDQGVRGKITIIAPSKITVAEAYKAFLSALAINGYAVVPSGNFLKIRSARNAQRDSIETYSGDYYPNADQMITRIIHLKHVSAEAINRELRILTSKDGEISVYQPTNSIIMSDFGANIDRVMKILSQLDVPGFEDQLEVIPVKFAKAKDIAELIDKVVNKGNDNTRRTGGTFTAGVPRFTRNTTSNQQGSAYYHVIPDDRTNSLVVVGNKPGIERIRKLLKQLDFKIRPEDAGGVYVYYVRHGEAEKIAQTLTGIAKETAKSGSSSSSATQAPNISPVSGVQAPSEEIFGSDVKITADKGTNSLVIVASKQDYEVILNLLNKIDIPRDQVFVETIIAEMKVTDSFNYQIGYFQFDKNGSGGKVGFNGFSDGSLADLLNPAGGRGTVLGFASGDTVQVRSMTGNTTTTISSLVGFINFLKTNANLNILSTPQILALDNQEASIEVGDKVVTGSQTTVNNGTPITNPTFEDATIKLKIKPFISPTTNAIRLEIDNSVKQPSFAKTPDAFKSNTQPLATRSIKTNIVVRNGDTAVLGGLMKEDELEEVTKVPLLGDIPILGWLFKSRKVGKEKTNMLIFLTPKVLRSAEDSQRLLGEKLEQRMNYIKSMGGRDPYGQKMDEIQKRQAMQDTTAPAPIEEAPISEEIEDIESIEAIE